MIREHDRVVLTVPVSDRWLEPGDVGVVVHVYPRQEAYEVEFVTLAGQTAAILTGRFSKARPNSAVVTTSAIVAEAVRDWLEKHASKQASI